MVRRLAVAIVVFGSFGVLVVTASPAGALCRGQHVWYEPLSAARGDRITIAGDGWGDDCHDSGPPPGGEGVLGKPIKKLTISLVQGDRRIPVARGAADENYEFSVRIRVPGSLEPGGANVVATWHRAADQGGEIDFMTDQLGISDDPAPRTARQVKVVKFGR